MVLGRFMGFGGFGGLPLTRSVYGSQEVIRHDSSQCPS